MRKVFQVNARLLLPSSERLLLSTLVLNIITLLLLRTEHILYQSKLYANLLITSNYRIHL